jgi:hypothetical protein
MTREEPMTEAEVKRLWKLLGKFYEVKNKDGADHLSVGEKQIVRSVREWVRWYARDEMSVELD